MDVSLVLTHACNLRCPYCYAGEKFDREMERDVAERALAFAERDEAERVQISFFGGEPLLSFERMREYTELARQMLEPAGRRLKFVVTTNGTCFTDERLELLKRESFFVGLSIDGVREAHDVGRPFVNGRGSFDAVCRGLAQLQAAGVDFETISVVHPSNVAYLGETVRFLVNQGVRRIALNPNFAADWSDDDLLLWEAGYRDIGETTIDCFKRGHLVEINIIHDKILTHLKGGYKIWDRCQFGKGSIAVAPSGNIYPCERMVGEDRDDRYRIGTVFDGFTSRRACLIQQSGNSCEDCGGCALFDRCMSWCACSNLSETGKCNVPGGVLCWHEQTAIEIADSVATRLYNDQNPMFLQSYYLR